MNTQFYLLQQAKFLPLFLTQFLGAFNDNAFKNALVILITYVFAVNFPASSVNKLTALAFGIFILPMFLFSAIAGQLADKLEKSRLIQIIKFVEILLMILAAIGFYYKSLEFLLFVLFCMGAQSAFFGPLKYSILPFHLQKSELIAGNGLIEAATFLAILLGTIVGGVLVSAGFSLLYISILVVFIAFFGFIASLFIPKAKAAMPDLEINKNIFISTWNLLMYTKSNNKIFVVILSISWFWFLGALYLAQFPVYTKVILGGTESIVILLLTVFAVGIGVGSLLCNTLLKGKVHVKYVPFGALGMALFGIDLYFVSYGKYPNAANNLIGIREFLLFGNWSNIRVLFDVCCIALCGGIYIVPLYAVLQVISDERYRARVIASNNVLNAFFMVISSIIIMLLTWLNFTVFEIFLTASICGILVAALTFKLREI